MVHLKPRQEVLITIQVRNDSEMEHHLLKYQLHDQSIARQIELSSQKS